MDVKVVNKLPTYKKSLYDQLENAVKEAARDTFISAKEKAPFRKGQLRASGIFEKNGALKQRVSFNKVYAAYQEFGGDGRRKIKHYTTSGTGAKFLKESGDTQGKKMIDKVKKYSKLARA